MRFLFPGNESVFIIGPDQHDDIAANPHRSFHLLHIHQEAGVSGDREHPAIGMHNTGGDCTGQCESHRTKTIRNQAGIRFMALVMPGNPHFVRTDIGQQDVMRAHDLPRIPKRFLRANRALGIVVLVLGKILAHRRPGLLLSIEVETQNIRFRDALVQHPQCMRQVAD